MNQSNYPTLSIAEKKELLDSIAVDYILPYNLTQNVVKQHEQEELDAVKLLVIDYFLHSKNPAVSTLRTELDIEMEEICQIDDKTEVQNRLHKMVNGLYQPEIVTLLFVFSIRKICSECGIKNSEAVDKEYRIRNVFFSKCKEDNAKHITDTQSTNPTVRILSEIVKAEYDRTQREYGHSPEMNLI